MKVNVLLTHNRQVNEKCNARPLAGYALPLTRFSNRSIKWEVLLRNFQQRSSFCFLSSTFWQFLSTSFSSSLSVFNLTTNRANERAMCDFQFKPRVHSSSRANTRRTVLSTVHWKTIAGACVQYIQDSSVRGKLLLSPFASLRFMRERFDDSLYISDDTTVHNNYTTVYYSTLLYITVHLTV